VITTETAQARQENPPDSSGGVSRCLAMPSWWRWCRAGWGATHTPATQRGECSAEPSGGGEYQQHPDQRNREPGVPGHGEHPQHPVGNHQRPPSVAGTGDAADDGAAQRRQRRVCLLAASGSSGHAAATQA